ncbi:MAG: DUF4131 domain-containing protein [Candidatus Moranbacteria bacterium]|nr:DUF4131 domain-containing protein [Candidatus Moranbacteria bacterium]
MRRILFILWGVVILRAIMLCIGLVGTSCPEGDICNLAGKEVEIIGKVVSLPQERLEKMIISVEVQEVVSPGLGQGLNSGVVQIVLSHTRYNLFYGDRIQISGKVKLPQKNSGDNFSFPLYLAGEGIFSTIYDPKVSKDIFWDPSLNLTLKERLLRKLYLFRERIRDSLNTGLPEPDSAILNAMVIGDQSGISQKQRTMFSQTGVVHILSVSGAHITLFLAILVFILNKIFSRRKIIFFFAASGIAFYIILTGAPDCAVRSGMMGVLAFSALISGRLADFKNLFWLSMAFLLLMDPYSLIADIGFQLSYLAVFGMVYVFPLIDKALVWGREGLFWKGIRIVLLSTSVSLAVSPLILYYFGVVSWISAAANLLLLPFFSLLLPFGFLLGIMGLGVSFLEGIIWTDPLLFAIKNVGHLVHFIFYLIYRITDWLCSIPLSYSLGTIKIGWVAVYYFLLLGAVLVFQQLLRKNIFPRRLNYFGSKRFLENPRTPCAGFLKLWKLKRQFNKKFVFISCDKALKRLLFFWFLVVGFLFSVSVSYLYSSSRPPRLAMLDVGQGDAFLLYWPRFHFQILLDGGPGRRVLAELGETMPFYDKKVEIIILSHFHQDHLEGLISVLERYQVNYAFLSSLPPAEPPELCGTLWEDLAEKKVAVVVSKRGQKIFFSTANKKVTELEFLTPFFDYSNYRIIDINDQSVIFKMNYPRQILFMGDASVKLEKSILDKAACPQNGEEACKIRAEALKIGHHGSRFSSSNVFLDAVQPRIALISAGKNNLFGHPSPATIKKLEEKEVQIHRTDLAGRVEIELTE